MKRLIILALILNISILNAAIITVDNKVPSAGNYSTLQAAHDAASNGDIIYVFPSLVPYAAITVTKQLMFYGVGFDITENIGEPFTPAASISGTMDFQSGSEGSHIEGFDGNFNVSIYANNITIKKNDLAQVDIFGSGSASTILQNKVTSHISINASTSNIIIYNNIIDLVGTFYAIRGGKNHIIYNNVIKSSSVSIYNMQGSEIVNNIIILGNLDDFNDCVFRYNIYFSSSSYLSSGIGNLQNIDMNTVFVDHENYDFHLLPDSPARGAGENGTDMGIYGGDAPYVDGGFPALPSILQIQAPIIGSQQSGLDINFKAKSNK